MLTIMIMAKAMTMSSTAGFLYNVVDNIRSPYFFARAIGRNTSRDAAKTGEYQVIFPSFRTLGFTLARLVFIRTKLLK